MLHHDRAECLDRGPATGVHGLIYNLEDGLLHDLSMRITGVDQLEAIYRMGANSSGSPNPRPPRASEHPESRVSRAQVEEIRIAYREEHAERCAKAANPHQHDHLHQAAHRWRMAHYHQQNHANRKHPAAEAGAIVSNE
jgi:hypothetical protein